MDLRRFLAEEKGSITIIMVTGILVLIGAAALSIDYGNMQGTYAKMRTAADAGALAGVCRVFALDGGTLVVNPNSKEIAKKVALSNGIPLDEGKTVAEILDDDIVFGKWDFANKCFTSTVDPATNPDPVQIDTCQVTVRKNQEVNGRETHLFASSSNDITVVSRAYVGYAGNLPGGTAFPLVIFKDMLPEIKYGQDNPVELTTNSDPDDNCGYTNLMDSPGHATLIREYVRYCNNDGGTAPPEVKVGDSIWLNNGDHANVYNYLQDSQASWPNQEFAVILPVVAESGGDQKFTHIHEVVDFVSFVITEVISPGQGEGHENHGQGQTHPHRYRGYFRQAKVKSGETPGQTAGNYGLRTIGTALIP